MKRNVHLVSMEQFGLPLFSKAETNGSMSAMARFDIKEECNVSYLVINCEPSKWCVEFTKTARWLSDNRSRPGSVRFSQSITATPLEGETFSRQRLGGSRWPLFNMLDPAESKDFVSACSVLKLSHPFDLYHGDTLSVALKHGINNKTVLLTEPFMHNDSRRSRVPRQLMILAVDNKGSIHGMNMPSGFTLIPGFEESVREYNLWQTKNHKSHGILAETINAQATNKSRLLGVHPSYNPDIVKIRTLNPSLFNYTRSTDTGNQKPVHFAPIVIKPSMDKSNPLLSEMIDLQRRKHYIPTTIGPSGRHVQPFVDPHKMFKPGNPLLNRW